MIRFQSYIETLCIKKISIRHERSWIGYGPSVKVLFPATKMLPKDMESMENLGICGKFVKRFSPLFSQEKSQIGRDPC